MWFASDRHFWYWKWRTPSKAEAEKEVSLLETKCKKRRDAVTFDCIVLLSVGRLVCSECSLESDVSLSVFDGLVDGLVDGAVFLPVSAMTGLWTVRWKGLFPHQFLQWWAGSWFVFSSVSVRVVIGWFTVRVFISVSAMLGWFAVRVFMSVSAMIGWFTVSAITGWFTVRVFISIRFCTDRLVHDLFSYSFQQW